MKKKKKCGDWERANERDGSSLSNFCKKTNTKFSVPIQSAIFCVFFCSFSRIWSGIVFFFFLGDYLSTLCVCVCAVRCGGIVHNSDDVFVFVACIRYQQCPVRSTNRNEWLKVRNPWNCFGWIYAAQSLAFLFLRFYFCCLVLFFAQIKKKETIMLNKRLVYVQFIQYIRCVSSHKYSRARHTRNARKKLD